MIEADFETRSDIDIRTHGAYVYFESPRARVLLGSFKIGDERLRWRFGEPCPARLAQLIESGATISALRDALIVAEAEREVAVLAERKIWTKAAVEAHFDKSGAEGVLRHATSIRARIGESG